MYKFGQYFCILFYSIMYTQSHEKPLLQIWIVRSYKLAYLWSYSVFPVIYGQNWLVNWAPGANHTIMSYNATSSLVYFENKHIFFHKTLYVAYYNVTSSLVRFEN
jgi:hypothetical protein